MACVLATSLLVGTALADDGPALAYVAVAGCPDEGEFRALVLERGADFARPTTDLTALEVTIEPRGRKLVGTLEVVHQGERSAPREVAGEHCDDVARGLAVVSAIALGAPNREVGAEAVSAGPSEPAPGPRREAPTASPTAAASPSTPPTPKPALRDSSFGGEPEVRVEAGTLRFERFSTQTLGGGARFGLIPAVLPRFDLTLSSAPFLVTPSGATRLTGPIVQVRWSYSSPTRFQARGYEAEAWALSAIPAICSGISYGSQGLSTAVCAEFEVGVLQAKIQDGAGGQVERNVAVASAGLSLNAQYHLSTLLHLDLRAGGLLQMPSAPSAPDGRDLFDPSIFGGYVALGVGLHF